MQPASLVRHTSLRARPPRSGSGTRRG
jgi:hypothetical protein